ncbi:unnamed protein product [Effrenium voratum]|nr:unnamed protein product [Effrenium voratum]
MIEAVGHDYLPGYFGAFDECLKPGGKVAIQAICVPDERYETYRRRVRTSSARRSSPVDICPALPKFDVPAVWGGHLCKSAPLPFLLASHMRRHSTSGDVASLLMSLRSAA